VKFMARRDPAGYLRYGASQSEAGARLLAQHGLTREMTRSIVFIDGDQIYLRSDATLRIAKHLTFPWHLAGVLLWIPRPLRDLAYRFVAAVRHRLAGRSNACEIPPPELRGRMIQNEP
jgi:predicted DCC family thiol-disulfide oxidoreductase YuxK